MQIAKLQRFLVIFSLVFWLGLAWLFRLKNPMLALFFMFMPVLAMGMALAMQCIWAACVNRQHSQLPQAGWMQWLKAWRSEWALGLKIFAWRQPFEHRKIPDVLTSTPGQRGLVLVHGYLCNRAFWQPWLWRCQAEGRVCVAVDLDPAFASVDRYATIVGQAIAKVQQLTGMPPVVVGHSMGGLAIRAWAVSAGADLDQVHRIMTLGTPHQGTAIAAWSHTPNGLQMRRFSEWTQNNAAQLPANFYKKTTCVYSNCDNIVFPAHTASLNSADNRHWAGLAHVQLAFVPAAYELCWSSLSDVDRRN